MRDFYDVIVIGGGHAGVEAAWAAASCLQSRTGDQCRVALITMDASKIGVMSCNPAIGGLAKGQMVREIDALGGVMGLAADATGIMFKMLNTSKGAAVRGPRAQCDKYAYAAEVQRLISTRNNIDVITATVDDVLVEHGRISGVCVPRHATIVHADPHLIDRNLSALQQAHPIYPSPSGMADAKSRVLRCNAVVLTTGTFMRALMHTGEKRTEGGRVNEGSAKGIAASLRRLGLELGRLKTGTPPRLARETIDWERLPAQHGDTPPSPFSECVDERFPRLSQIACRVSHTTPEAHEVIRSNLHRAPMYSGQIDAECGPRYCPSIEDKVVRFADRRSHHVFLEPESLHTNEIYCNGISTSLPEDVQDIIVRAMPGCEHARILRYGYAVEYDMVRPHQIDVTGMVKSVVGLFLAGQINGTSGYEEAAGQGLVAGVNAALVALHAREYPQAHLDSIREHANFRLGRNQAYIGVMMDDLVTRTPREPYRMFTSRAEHRLFLRSDNADDRLTPLGRELGLVDDRRWSRLSRKRDALATLRMHLDRTFVDGKSLREIARRPQTTTADLMTMLQWDGDLSLLECMLIEARYDGYIARQQAEVRRQSHAESQRIPSWLDAAAVRGLRRETVETLTRFRPQTLGQASRLAGVTPADLSLIAVHIKRGRRLLADAAPISAADTENQE